MDLLGLVVEDRPLDRPVEELVRVTAEELVERVLARHVHGEPRRAAAGPAPHLAQARHGPGERHADRGVEVADVDAELERVGGHHGQELALGQAALELATLGGRVAGAVGHDPLRQVAAPGGLQALRGEALDQLHAAARLHEADRPHVLLDQVGEQARCLRQRRSAAAERLVHERRVPHRDPPLGPRRAVAVHEREVEPGQALGELERVCDRRAREHEARLGPVGAREPAQAAQHVRHVRPEHAAVDVRLVHDDPGEVRQHVAPRAMVGKHPHVEHVGVREDQVRAPPDRRAILLGSVAVVDGLAEERAAAVRARPRAWSWASAFVGYR